MLTLAFQNGVLFFPSAAWASGSVDGALSFFARVSVPVMVPAEDIFRLS